MKTIYRSVKMVRENSKNIKNKKAKRGDEEEEVSTSTGVVQISNKEPVEFELSPNCSTIAEQADFLLKKINGSRGELLGLELDGPMKLSAIFKNNIAVLDHQVKLNPAAKYTFRFKLDERVEKVGEIGPNPLDEMVIQLANEEEVEVIKCENQVDNSIAPNSEEVIAPVAEMSQVANQTPTNGNGVLTVNVPSLDAFDDAEGKHQTIDSTVEKIGGVTWQMEVHKVVNNVNNKPIQLNLHIHCNEEVEDHLWLCIVTFKLASWAVGEEEPFDYCSYDQCYAFNGSSWILTNKNVMKKLKKGPIELKFEIEVCRVPEMEKRFPPLDTSLVVNMGEGKSETMLVNKDALAKLSSFFRKLFLQMGTFEINENEDFHMEYFKTMLYAAMTMGKEVRKSDMLDYFLAVEYIEMGTKYDFPMMVKYCEEYLMDPKNKKDTENRSKMKLLELADKHGLVKLKEHCLDKMSVKDFTDDHDKIVEIYLRLSKSTQKCLKAKLSKLALKLEKQIRGDKAKGATSKDFNNTKTKIEAMLGKIEASKTRSGSNAAERDDKNGDKEEEKQPKKEVEHPKEAQKGVDDVQIVGGIIRDYKCLTGMKRKGEEISRTDWPTITIEDPNDYGEHGPAKKQQKTSQQVKAEVPNNVVTGPELNQMQPTTSAAAVQPIVNHGNQQYWWEQERPAEPIKMLLRERKRRNN